MLASAWRPTASFENLRLRSNLLQAIRQFFQARGVVEVETPVCSAAAVSDPALDSLSTIFTGPGAASGKRLYLHTSPEFAMKRLLAAGSGPIYQICKVFRDGEGGRYHNPEFTLLEWYRPGYDHHQLMDELTELVRYLFAKPIDVRRLSYGALFLERLGIDPHGASGTALRSHAIAAGVAGAEQLELEDADGWLDLLMTHCIEPNMGPGMVLVYDYPASQASLARIRPGPRPLAERFELYLDGVELANGFHELTDAAEQRRRFGFDLERRRRQNRPELPLDEHLLAALEAGLPDCSGVALGIDRLLMCMAGADHIEQVLAFPIDRA
ncbi:MAG: EF-P lysine aminoacylase GenX [Chromatiaceae bacterium]|nr:EF-P lysine aminoacylase GenX [Chromatiaceae bacterium]